MFNLSVPSPETAPRLESLGPHFKKIFFSGRWEPLHLLIAADTGPPHDHAYSMKHTKIINRGYRENVWVLTEGGGYFVHLNVERRPGTMHDIDAETIHLITALLPGEGPSVSEPEPGVAGRVWYHYLPREDGSVQRSRNWDGPWEDYHPAGPVHQVEHGDLQTQGIARLAPAAAAGSHIHINKDALIDDTLGATNKLSKKETIELFERSSTIIYNPHDFVIGPNNTGWQAWKAMLAGHQVRRPHWHDTRRMFIVHIPADGFAFPKPTLDLMITTMAGAPLWKETAVVTSMRADNLEALDWIVLPQIDVEPPVI